MGEWIISAIVIFVIAAIIWKIKRFFGSLSKPKPKKKLPSNTVLPVRKQPEISNSGYKNIDMHVRVEILKDLSTGFHVVLFDKKTQHKRYGFQQDIYCKVFLEKSADFFEDVLPGILYILKEQKVQKIDHCIIEKNYISLVEKIRSKYKNPQKRSDTLLIYEALIVSTRSLCDIYTLFLNNPDFDAQTNDDIKISIRSITEAIHSMKFFADHLKKGLLSQPVAVTANNLHLLTLMSFSAQLVGYLKFYGSSLY